MEEIMGDADQPTARFGAEALDRAVGVDDPRPGERRHLVVDAGFIEKLIALPQAQPCLPVVGRERPDLYRHDPFISLPTGSSIRRTRASRFIRGGFGGFPRSPSFS